MLGWRSSRDAYNRVTARLPWGNTNYSVCNYNHEKGGHQGPLELGADLELRRSLARVWRTGHLVNERPGGCCKFDGANEELEAV
jgi:hypothetical protein